MKKVSLNCNITTLKGEVVKDQTGKDIKMNELVADMLVGGKGSDNAMRKLHVAQAMYLDGDMELEDADHKLVVKAVKDSQASVLVVAQILEALGEKE